MNKRRERDKLVRAGEAVVWGGIILLLVVAGIMLIGRDPKLAWSLAWLAFALAAFWACS